MPIVLILIGIVLIVYNYIAIKKENTSFEIIDHEEVRKENYSFGSILEKNKDELNDYKIELGIFRRDIAESLTELQEEILEIKKHLNIVKNDDTLYEDKREMENVVSNINDVDIRKDVISEISFKKRKNNITDSNKTERIKEFLNRGLTEEEICHKLSISKGEVLLVKDLFRK